MASAMKDWDAAYSNMNHVAGSAALPGHWAAEASAYRAGHAGIETDIAYGPGDREQLDLVWPDGTPKGLAVFVHGGYWMRLSKSDWTQLAEGARAKGWAVAIPSYTLAPEARLSEITQQIAAAITKASEIVDGPLRLAGHSAGGHLVSRMICDPSPLSPAVLDRVEHVLSISGLHDLRPLMKTQMNETLNLTLDEARAESACLLEPVAGSSITAWVGGGELREFLRQAELLARLWDGLDAKTRLVVDGVHHHFSVIEGLKDPASPITIDFVGP